MTRMTSRAVADTRVYAQDTAPSDQRDGIMWVDTSDPSRPVAVYSVDSAQWEPVNTDVPIFVTQEAVSFDESGLVLPTHRDLKARNGSVGFDPAVDATTSRPADNNTTNTSAGVGLRFVPNQQLNRVTGTVSANTPSRGYDITLYEGGNSTPLASKTATLAAGDTVAIDHPMDKGRAYNLVLSSDDGTSVDIGIYGTVSTQSGTALDITDGALSDGTFSSFAAFSDLRGTQDLTRGQVSVGFDTIPTDLSGWDIATWQQYEQDGTIEEMRVETNDGSGWTTYASSQLPPVDIGSVPADSDVRVWMDLSRPTAADTGPEIPYVARRGER